MARIAIVETYPYEAVWGGDAVYFDRLRQYLLDAGHEVTTFVTDITRGRSDPRLQLRSRATNGGHRWQIRHAVALGPQRFLGLHPIFLPRLVARALGKKASRINALSAGEALWLERSLARFRPDAVVLLLGACSFTPRLLHSGKPILALMAFLTERKLRLGEAIPEPMGERAQLDAFKDATIAAFNNRADLDHYAATTGATNGAILNMGFPRRAVAPMPDLPDMLMVAAHTRPNIESLQWLLDGAWPAIREAIPNARLRVVGAIGRAFADRIMPEGVEIVGFADDLDAEYARAALVLAPFTAGTGGVKVKVAEAISYGRPLITTSIGVDPADRGQFGEAVDVADTPAAFAAAAIRLLADPQLRNARAALVQAQYDRHFSESAAYAPVIAMLQTMASC
jgi:glycosyltransferase involved in cell wall biosynthesis